MTATLTPAPVAAPPPVQHTLRKSLHRIAFFGLLAGTAVLYLWNLTASGYGNEFYAAATQAASRSWKALLFGSLDPGNTITVDKPPAFLWVSGLFAKAAVPAAEAWAATETSASAARPASPGCSAPAWARRSPGCCPRRWSASAPGCGSCAAHHAPTALVRH